MTTHQAKQIPIDEFLATAGHNVAKTSGGCKWYIRPYGPENHASFKLSPDAKAWFDHGTGQGGNIIDLAILMGNCADLPQALDYIQRLTGLTSPTTPTTPPRPPRTAHAPAYVIQAHQPLTDTRGIEFLRSRALDPIVLHPYLREVYFTRQTNPAKRAYYGVALPNRSGGFETRSPFEGQRWLKTLIGPKDITAFRLNPQAAWITFEGMPDFGSFLSVDNPPANTFNYLILNGTGMTKRATQYLASQPATSLIICSQAGQGASQAKDELSQWARANGWERGDMDHRWAGFQDYNAKLMHDRQRLNASVQPAGRPPLKTTPKLGP